MMKNIDFKLFTVLWNQQQNMKTPILHLNMAQWLEEAWKNGDTRLLLMAFRSAGKSTLVGLFCGWLLYLNPNLRILVLAADFTLAKKMVRNVKRIIEHHPLTKNMKPDSADQWASDRFTVKRIFESRDPSMMAKGVSSNITGSRADIVICDDVEVPNTCDSAPKRGDLRTRLNEMSYVLTASGTQLYVGTPHHYYSIYADIPRTEIGEEKIFLDDFKRLSLPILDKDGASVWEEKYSMKVIEQIKRDTGPNKFESQMMLRSVNILEGRLNPDLLQFHSEEFSYCPVLDEIYIGNQKMVSASCWWDPAFGSAHGDSSVCAVMFTDMLGNYYLQHIEYIKINQDDKMDEAQQQVRIVASLAKKFHLPAIVVEINGIGKFLPPILRNELERINCPCTARGLSSTRSKDMRILESFDVVMAAERLFVHEDVRKTPFVMEMREWRPKGYGAKSKCHDDGLDAVAGAISMEPDRIKRTYAKGSYSWRRGAKTHRAKGDFDV